MGAMSIHHGFFITFEGGEGSGKSTQARLLHRNLQHLSIPSQLTLEPGGTQMGNRVRSILKVKRDIAISTLAELFLFSACRAQLTGEVIRPALEGSKVVICDRYSDSTTVYQGCARGLDMAVIKQVNAIATGGLVPGLTVLLDVSPEAGLKRKKKTSVDRFEAEETSFHQKVRHGYLMLAKDDPGRWIVLDATLPATRLAETILEEVRRRLKSAGLP